MPKKLTHAYVKEKINQEYTLLSTTYKNAHAKLKIQCDKGHVYHASWHCFQIGNRCPICAGNVKLTYEYIKEYIERDGYTLLSKEYINAKTKLTLQCDKGHMYKITWRRFKRGDRCLICSINNRRLTHEYIKKKIESVDGYKLLSEGDTNSKLKIQCDKGHIYYASWHKFRIGRRCHVCNINPRHSYEYVKNEIEQVGYTLLSTEYINVRTKLRVRCDKGHEYSVNWSGFQGGDRCPECYGNKKLTYEYIKEQIESVDGYKLLSDEYINSAVDLVIRCDKNHEYKSTWNSFQQGSRCSVCAGNTKLTYEYVKEQINQIGYTLLSKEYVNAKSILRVMCDKGHEYSVNWNNFQRGRRCPMCYGNVKYTLEYVKGQVESVGYELLSDEYTNNRAKLKVKCDKGHIYSVRFDNFMQGQRCSSCSNNGTSKAEQEIQEHVKTLTDNVICNDRTQILNPLTDCYLELDIYLPDLNKAIEYNGIYWHSFPNAINKDALKREECNRLGIDLLVINESDYLSDKDKTLSIINDFISNQN